MAQSNFKFLEDKWPLLSKLAELAEKNLYSDPNTTMIKLRMFGEKMVEFIIAEEKLADPYERNQISRLNLLKEQGLIEDEIVDMFHAIRKTGNMATHDVFSSEKEASTLLSLAHKMATWFMQVYGDYNFEPAAFVLPDKSLFEKAEVEEEIKKLSDEYEEKLKGLAEELEKLRSKELTEQQQKERQQYSKKVAKKIELDESETRKIIDEKLRLRGWETDSIHLKWANGTRPEKGKNMAIAEWPMDPAHYASSKKADYALFIGLQLVGFVEAKRFSKNVMSDLVQAKEYSRAITAEDVELIGEGWGEYKVPFLFSTNGRKYLKQLEHLSGIWFVDVRKSTNHPRVLQDYYTPQGLTDLLKENKQTAEEKLNKESFEYMMEATGLNLRGYQVDAIKSVEKAIVEGKREVLLAMATGTGKTRTIIGLVYRLVKSKLFKRILFLVDRTALGEQAGDAFKETVIENLSTFNSIYDIKEIEDKLPDKESKVHITTVQGMVKRIFYNADEATIPSVDMYDCIIVDEAHRGYLLDKEMGEEELLFRNEDDYVSKYRMVLEYFDAVRIGLTATPAQHTTQIFGKPVYTYSYRDAVIDGFLIDHEPPHKLKTKLSTEGIEFKKGEIVPVYDNETKEIINSDELPDDMHFDVDKFNKRVVNENFNSVVLGEIAQYIDPEGPEKTLIFAATDSHADLIVKILKEEYEKIGVAVDDDAIMKITGSIYKPLEAIRKFKNERYPTIVSTVDLLTTGIDVPEICNLVFLRCVRSRILYEQMMGRATRRADNIKKSHFNIYDAVSIYETLEKVSNMKPVVTKPSVTFEQLVEELQQLENEQKKRVYADQIAAKLQRKLRRFKPEDMDRFKELSGGKTPGEFINWLKSSPAEELVKTVEEKKKLFSFLDEARYEEQYVFISDAPDVLKEHTIGYGTTEKPEDYLQEFAEFINENINKIPALQIVCTRPKELTRKELKELKRELDKAGFSQTKLNTAWNQAKNEDIVADIISFVRQQALGDSLVSHEERIKNAVNKARKVKSWTPIQKKWLDRIEAQLIAEDVIDRECFDEGSFKSSGGFDRINKVFNGELDQVIDLINDNLYTRMAANE